MDQLPLWSEFSEPPKHRLFLAIRPDPGAIGSLTCLTRQLRNDGAMTGRPVDPDRLHVTLHWLGDVADQLPRGWISEASSVASSIRTQPFTVVFDRVAGSRGLLLLPARDGSEALNKFQQTLSDTLIASGLPHPERRRFAPHMTLSYGINDVPERQIDPIRWIVQDFVLIESLLGERRHIERGRWPIQG